MFELINPLYPEIKSTVFPNSITRSYNQINLYIYEQESLKVNTFISKFFEDVRFLDLNIIITPRSVTNRYHEINEHINEQKRFNVNGVIT